MGYDKLAKAGLKTTVQRVAILEYLENTESHPSVESVYKFIHNKYPSITLSTVYNTLEIFAKKRIINKIYTLEGKSRYDAKIEKHHHLFDKTTGKVLDIYDDELNEILCNYISKKKIPNAKITDFSVEFIGEIK